MGNPKRRHSHGRGAMRRAHDFLKAPGTAKCKRCGNTILPHRVCGNCGYYADVKKIDTKKS